MQKPVLDAHIGEYRIDFIEEVIDALANLDNILPDFSDGGPV
jgi:hypothetical protein